MGTGKHDEQVFSGNSCRSKMTPPQDKRWHVGKVAQNCHLHQQTRAAELRPEQCPGTVLIVKLFTVPAELWLRLSAAPQDPAKAWLRNWHQPGSIASRQPGHGCSVWEVRVFLKALLYHLRSAAQTCAKRMEMLDPGFPACLGSLKIKLHLFLSLFNACQPTTSIGGGQHSSHCTAPVWAENELYKEESQMCNDEGTKAMIIGKSFWHMNGEGCIQLKTADCTLP